MRFKMLLWILGLRLRFLSRNNESFRKDLENKKAILQFQTRDASVARYYVIADTSVTSHAGVHPGADMVLAFEDAQYAYAVILEAAKDHGKFMEGVYAQRINAAGDLSLLMWVMSLAKYLRGENGKTKL